MNLFDILKIHGFDIQTRCKMMRHQSSIRDVEEIFKRGHINAYQAVQSKEILNCDYLISFIGRGRPKACFAGIWRVEGFMPIKDFKIEPNFPYPEFYAVPDDIYYNLKPVGGFEDLIGRMIIDWGPSTRAWHQWLRDKPIIEILPKGQIKPFPGYLDFTLSYADLCQMMNFTQANRAWHQMLSSIAGVYLIIDRLSGQQYVGSAYGKDGIIGRWKQYAANGHGGNTELKRLLKSNSGYARNLQFTILRTLPSSMTAKEVIAYEQIYKGKLGTRAHGLNMN